MKSSRPASAVSAPESADQGSFLSRWSRRKAAVREGKAVAPEPPAPVEPRVAPKAESAAPVQRPTDDEAPVPTLADVALLKPGDTISRFVARGVDEQVKRAALKTLFADPHFNVMDGLDIYIDDYTKPDPIPPDVLRQLRQSETLGLFDPIEEEGAQASDIADAQGRAEALDTDNAAAGEGRSGAIDSSAAVEPATQPAMQSAVQPPVPAPSEPAGTHQADSAREPSVSADRDKPA